jgi:serine/threonine-protein kinase
MTDAEMDAGQSGPLGTIAFLVVLTAVVAGALAWPFLVNRPMLPADVIDAGMAMPGPADDDMAEAMAAAGAELEGEISGGVEEEEAVIDAGVAQGPYDPDSGIPALVVRAEPRVGVSLNGRFIGRTPLLHWPAPPGKAVLALMDRTRSVNVTRSIVIADNGITSTDIYLAKGYINVSAPEGAKVYVDGRPLGTGPMRDVGVYEGHHHIQVKVDRFRWEETFEIAPQQHLTFTVDFD